MIKKIALATSAAIAFTAAPAFAQDAQPAGGAFVGVVTGYDNSSISDEVDSVSGDGVLYGITAGYDFAMGSTVFGVEAELTDSTAGSTATIDGITGEIDAATDIYVGARIGFAIDNGTLFYVKGGYTTGRVEIEYRDEETDLSEGDELNGYRLGAGVQMPFGKNLAGRLEYRYSDYGEYSYEGEPTGLSADRHQVALVLGMKF